LDADAAGEVKKNFPDLRSNPHGAMFSDFISPAELQKYANLQVVRACVEGFLLDCHKIASQRIYVEFAQHRAYVQGYEIAAWIGQLFARRIDFTFANSKRKPIAAHDRARFEWFDGL